MADVSTHPPSKICASCGRSFQWRARWAQNWPSVRFCSAACRRKKPSATDEALEVAIVDLLKQRARGATICPSEAARRVWSDDVALSSANMERTRCAARRLVERGVIEIVQKGRVVDPDHARGPIRLRYAAR